MGRLYCCERHRREYQNERRREERAEARELREAGKNAMPDPWARNDLDEWTAEDMYANALIDPCPDMTDTPWDRLRRAIERMKARERRKCAPVEQGWLC